MFVSTLCSAASLPHDRFVSPVARSLCAKYCDGKIPENKAYPLISVGDLRAQTEADYGSFNLDHATGRAIEALGKGNKYVQDKSPWHMKADDPERVVIVRTLLELIYVASVFLQPVLLTATAEVFKKLASPPILIKAPPPPQLPPPTPPPPIAAPRHALPSLLNWHGGSFTLGQVPHSKKCRLHNPCLFYFLPPLHPTPLHPILLHTIPSHPNLLHLV